MRELQAQADGAGRRIGIVVSRFNELVTRELLSGALECLRRHDVADEDIIIAWVPGAWEIPAALAQMAKFGRYDAMVALGAVIRGATPHFDYVAGGVANGVATVSQQTGLPIAFGVLTTDNLEQALERVGVKVETDNKGWDAALAALEMANLFDRLAG